MKTTIAIVAVLAVGCGGESDPCPVEAQYWTDLGIGIYVEEDAAEWAQAPDLGGRVDRIAVAVATYAGSDSSAFVGRIVVLRSAALVSCGNYGEREGCCHDGWIDVATGMDYSMEMFIPLIGHEMLHLLIGDPDHLSPLWDRLWFDCLRLVH